MSQPYRSESHCICVCPNCSRPKQRCKDICQNTGRSTITYDHILSKLKCCWILAMFGYFLHICLLLYFSGYIQREFGAATAAGWIGFLDWFETIGKYKHMQLGEKKVQENVFYKFLVLGVPKSRILKQCVVFLLRKKLFEAFHYEVRSHRLELLK